MLSLIIPTYNSRNTIKQCINSILKLKSVPFEIIIVDDGSTDGTIRINDKYDSKYQNIKSLHQNHAGVSEARNRGLLYAKGSWVTFIDSDDTVNSMNLEKLYRLYGINENDLIISNINLNGKDIGIHENSDAKYNVNNFVRNTYPIYKNLTIMDNSGKIYNMDVIRKYKLRFMKKLNYGEDFIFTLNFLMHCHKYIIQSRFSYYNYNVNSNSSVMNYDSYRIRNELDIFNVLKKVYHHFKLPLAALKWIKIRMAYSILLNDLNAPVKNKLKLLEQSKKDIIRCKMIEKSHYKSLECYILILIFKQPSLYVIYLVLTLISIRSKLINMHKI